jgi:hypothetical protein
MRRLILGLAADPIAEPDLNGSDAVGIDAETQTYLDGARIAHGQAATTIERERTAIDYGHDYVETYQEPTTERVATEFFADLDAEPGFVTVDKGDGEFLFDYVGVRNGTTVERAYIDVDRLRAAMTGRDKAECWHVAADTDDAVSMDYHDAAAFDADGTAAQVGFAYLWDGLPMRGVVAASGYAAIFHDHSAAVVGKWVREELLPYAEIDGDAQTEVDAE